jgi:PGF-CTERM protein
VFAGATTDMVQLRYTWAVGTPTVTAVGTPGKTPLANATVTTPPVNATTTAAAATTPTEPGFEAIYAIAGLLAVAFLVLRQRK